MSRRPASWFWPPWPPMCLFRHHDRRSSAKSSSSALAASTSEGIVEASEGVGCHGHLEKAQGWPPLPLLTTLPGVPGAGLAALPLPLLATLPGFPSAGLPGVPGPCCRREGRAQGDMEVEEVLKGCAYMLTCFCYPSGVRTMVGKMPRYWGYPPLPASLAHGQ